MNQITEETRRESHDIVKPTKSQRRAQILDVMGTDSLTVDEVIDRMLERGYLRFPDRNSVAPRLTEMEQDKILTVIGKRDSARSGRKIAVYRRVKS